MTEPKKTQPPEFELLDILRCPETLQRLAPAPVELLDRIEERRRGGSLRTRAGDTVAERVEAGFVRDDGRILYPVRAGIPVLLIGESIPLEA